MINIEKLRNILSKHHPQTAIILGSGLGGVANEISDFQTINYTDIEGFPQTTVSGHQGQMIVGHIGEAELICLKGRFHFYEGYSPKTIAEVIYALRAIGIKRLIVTNAAGSLNPDFTPGTLMLIRDHINFSGQNPLIGPNDENIGPRFLDMSNAYDIKLREQIKKTAYQDNIKLSEGVYMMVSGPTYETPAEVKAFRLLGADAIGMSTVFETIAGVHCGMRVLGISVITNYGSGIQKQPLAHQETLSGAQNASGNLIRLIVNYIKENPYG